MSYIQGDERHQKLLLPESIEEYVREEHPVRVIDAFVEGMDLGACGYESAPAATGRPGYRPADMVKLYLWGYVNRVRSSRRLELECGRNLEVMWLMGRLKPDFKTIADFRKDHAEAFKKVFRQFHFVCAELDLFGGELVAIDGTKLKAVNSTARNFDKAKLRKMLERMDQRLEEFLKLLDEGDGAEGEVAREGRAQMEQKLAQLRKKQAEYQAAMEEMEKSGATQVSMTDADCRRMHKTGPAYNAQIAVDAKHKLIVAQEVVNAGNDLGQLSMMAEAAQEALGKEKLQVVADGGYYDHEEILRCDSLGVEVHLPALHKGKAAAEGRFELSRFLYEPENDCYRCPAGEQLHFQSQVLKSGKPYTIYSNVRACKQCPLKAQCTPADGRKIMRWEHQDVIDRMHQRVAKNPEILARRKALVEHPFGSIKFWMEHRALLTRGLKNVNAEFSLSTLAYNFKRVVNILGTSKLLRHLKKKKALAVSSLLSAFHPLMLSLCTLRRRRPQLCFHF